MRKLQYGNKKAFTLYGIIIITIIVIFIIAIVKVATIDKQVYSVDENTFLMDENYMTINLEDDGTISKKWDNKFYLTSNDQKYTLGEYTFTYNENENKINIYGTSYQVLNNGSIEKNKKSFEVMNTNTTTFYKLSDRRYLIVGKNIYNDSNTFQTNNFLFVVIAKSGNALLINDKMNAKTLEPLIINSGEFKFDVANEILTINSTNINLKKINGSTNKYVASVEEENNDNEQNEENTNNNTESNQNNNNTINNDNNSNTINNSIITDNNTSSSNNNGYNFVAVKSASIKGLTSTSNTITVNYLVNDIKNEYASVFLILKQKSTDEGEKILLNKDDTSYRITNLIPNSEYEVSMGYSIITKSGEDKTTTEEISDSIRIRTKKVNNNLSITKISTNKIYFNLKIDNTYQIEYGIINLYAKDIDDVDYELIGSVEVNINQAVSTDGFSSSINSQDRYEYILKLENGVYNGQPTELNLQTRFINYS